MIESIAVLGAIVIGRVGTAIRASCGTINQNIDNQMVYSKSTKYSNKYKSYTCKIQKKSEDQAVKANLLSKRYKL